MPQYDSQAYWEERYGREPATFEWYQGYGGFKPLLHKHAPTTARILQVGVGTSRLQEDMVRLGGYKSVTSIDYSAAAIEHLQQLHKGVPELTYQVADCRNMPEFDNGSFDVVLDKGTLDAVLCGETAHGNVQMMLSECHRVLRPGGTMVIITYGDPLMRLPYLVQQDFPSWHDIQVYCVAKLDSVLGGAGLGMEATTNTGVAEANMVPMIKGPYSYTNVDVMQALSNQEGLHFVYVLTKEPARSRG